MTTTTRTPDVELDFGNFASTTVSARHVNVVAENGARGRLGPKGSAYEDRTPGGTNGSGFEYGRVPTGKWIVCGGCKDLMVDSEAAALALIE